MKIEARKVVTLEYDLYVDGENGQEELMEKATVEAPLVYCHGEGMMLPAFEQNMEGMNEGDSFDFRIACQDAYGEYDDEGVLTLDKKMFYNGDGEFDSERVYVGAIVPMNTVDGQIINAQIAEITKDNVTGQTRITGCDYIPVYTLTPERDGEPMKVVRIMEQISMYENNHISKVGEKAYQNMKSALEKIRSKTGLYN